MSDAVLYKYVSSSVAEIVLKTSTLRWASPLTFNDSCEFKRTPALNPSISEASKLVPEFVADVVFGNREIGDLAVNPEIAAAVCMGQMHMAEGMTRDRFLCLLPKETDPGDALVEKSLQQLFLRMARQARVLCLTTTYDNPKMWERYSENGSGCVLGFEAVDEEPSSLFKVKQVRYSAARPSFGSGLDFLLYRETDPFVLPLIEGTCYTKTQDWEYEDEWRAMDYVRVVSDEECSYYSFNPEELASITLGELVSDGFAKQVRRTAAERYPNATLFQLKRDVDQVTRIDITDG